MKLEKQEMIKNIGLVLMFTLGWVASDLVSQIGCKDCDSRQRGLERRMEMGERNKLQEFVPYNFKRQEQGTDRQQQQRRNRRDSQRDIA